MRPHSLIAGVLCVCVCVMFGALHLVYKMRVVLREVGCV